MPPDSVDQFTFRGEQFDRGLAVVQFPEGKGGLGISPKSQTVVNEELRKASRFYHDLNVNPIGIGMGMPTLLAHGDESLHHLLRACFTGEEVWCQLFSEPGSGSDVAGLASRAVADGDEWLVSGQKVWTTLAHTSKWGMLLSRTDPEAPKHRGMTYFLMDMQAPGVEVRPLFQITGEAEFNEVFMSDVRIPDSHRFGEVGDGWRVGLTTLMNERVALGGGVPKKGTGADRRPCRHLGQEPARCRFVRLRGQARSRGRAVVKSRDPAPHQLAGPPDGQIGHTGAGGLGRQAHLGRVEQRNL